MGTGLLHRGLRLFIGKRLQDERVKRTILGRRSHMQSRLRRNIHGECIVPKSSPPECDQMICSHVDIPRKEHMLTAFAAGKLTQKNSKSGSS